jgi:hypothetical protein
MKKTPKATTQTERYQYQFRPIKSYSAEEVLAAGGTTAFAHKMGKTAKKMAEALEKLPPVEFTDKEWDDLMEQLKNDK